MISIFLQQADPSTRVQPAALAAREPGLRAFGDDGLTFGDVIDMVNPLHHVPLLGSVYRRLTGDTIDPAIRIAGGALFGGPIGAAVSAVSVAIEEASKPAPAIGDSDTALAADASAEARRNTAALAEHQQRSRASATPASADSDRQRTARRGGWIVAAAYGDPIMRANERDDPRIRTSV